MIEDTEIVNCHHLLPHPYRSGIGGAPEQRIPDQSRQPHLLPEMSSRGAGIRRRGDAVDLPGDAGCDLQGIFLHAAEPGTQRASVDIVRLSRKVAPRSQCPRAPRRRIPDRGVGSIGCRSRQQATLLGARAPRPQPVESVELTVSDHSTSLTRRSTSFTGIGE